MTAPQEINYGRAIPDAGERRWWNFPRTAVKLFLVLALVFSLRCPADAANHTESKDKDDLVTYHLPQVPADATKGLGDWIWTDKTFDRQTCRLWKEFDIPSGAKVVSARLKMTVDDGYQFFLDGRELGQGAEWRALTEYDLTLLLKPGHHWLAVNCFNDLYLAGLIMNLSIQLNNGRALEIKSDTSWRVVPDTEKDWEQLKHPRAGWPAATVQSIKDRYRYMSRSHWPDDYMRVPRFQPVIIPFWQTGWFHLVMAFVSGLLLLACISLSIQLVLHAKEQRLLNLERARIARDIHDDFGTRLTRLILESEVAQNELAEGAKASLAFSRLGDGLREALEAMDEVLWAVNPGRDTVSDFVTYVCEYAQNFLKPAGIQCLLEVEPDMPALDFDLPLRRSLLLAMKEAVNNAAKHSGATKVQLRIHRRNSGLAVVVEDDGRGFDTEQVTGGRNGIGNMVQRMSEVGGWCAVVSAPGKGCRVEFRIPLTRQRPHLGWLTRRLRARPGNQKKPSAIET